MKKLILVIINFCSVFAYGQEQDSTARRMRWTNMIQVGQIFDGNEGVTGRFTGSWISGVEINKFIVGVELGYNNYDLFKLGSVSLYGKYRLFDKGFSPYGYGLIGHGHPAYFKEESQLDATNSSGGALYGGGIGFDIRATKVTWLFQLGYKFQKVSYDGFSGYYYFSDFSNSLFAPSNANGLHTKRKMNRIEFKVGLQF